MESVTAASLLLAGELSLPKDSSQASLHQLVEVRKGLRRGVGELDTSGQRQFLLHPWGRLPVSYRFLGVTLLGFWLVHPH